MSDDKPDGPDNKPTLTLPKVVPPDPAPAMLTEIRDATRSLVDSMAELHAWRGEVDHRLEAMESWRRRTSDRVKGVDMRTSENDAEQAAQLAQERAAREALAKDVSDLKTVNQAQVAALVRLERHATDLLGNKKVRIAGYAGLVILIAIAAKFGIHIVVPK